MATQTIEFGASSGQTITARLFSAGSDTVVDAASATERTNDKGTYRAAFTDLPAGTYRLTAIDIDGVLAAKWWVATSAEDGTYQAYEMPVIDLRAEVEAILEGVQDINETLANNSITVISHQQPGGGITLVQGDDYKTSNNRPLRWVNETGAGWPADISEATIKFTAIHELNVGQAIGDIPSTRKIIGTGSVVQATAPDQEVIVQLDSSVTAVDVGLYEYDVELIIGSDVTTLVTTAQPKQKPPSFAMPDVSTFRLEVLPQFTPAA